MALDQQYLEIAEDVFNNPQDQPLDQAYLDIAQQIYEGESGSTSPVTPSPESPFNQEQQAHIDKAKAFESSKLGKALSVPSKGMGAIVSALGLDEGYIPTSQRLEEGYLRKNQIAQLPMEDRIIERMKDIFSGPISRTAKAAPTLLAPGIGKGLAGVAKGALKTGGLIGGSRTVEELAEGSSLEEAARTGAKAGAVGAGVTAASPAVTKVIKGMAKIAVSVGSKVKGYAVRAAIKDPASILEPQPKLVDVGLDFKNQLDAFKGRLRTEFGNSMDVLSKHDNKKISLAPILKKINKYSKNDPKIASYISNQIKSQGVANYIPISKATTEAFTTGAKTKNISFDDAKKINSILHSLTDKRSALAAGSTPVEKLKGIKKTLLDEMEKVVPEVKKINKEYAKGKEMYKSLYRLVFNDDKIETGLDPIAKELLNIDRKKTYYTRLLKKFEKETGSDISQQIKRAAISKEFETQGMGEMMDLMRFSMGGMMGAAYLGPLIGPAAGSLVGSFGAHALTSPQATRGLVEAGSRIGQSKGTQVLSEIGRRLLPVAASRSVDGN